MNNSPHLACGVDIVHIDSLKRTIEVTEGDYLSRVFTSHELTTCENDVARLAMRLAAKEAVAKTLGTGLRSINWQEIEVQSQNNGQPHLVLHRRAAACAEVLGFKYWYVSLSNSQNLALAFVIAQIGKGETTMDFSDLPAFRGIASIFEGRLASLKTLSLENQRTERRV